MQQNKKRIIIMNPIVNKCDNTHRGICNTICSFPLADKLHNLIKNSKTTSADYRVFTPG